VPFTRDFATMGVGQKLTTTGLAEGEGAFTFTSIIVKKSAHFVSAVFKISEPLFLYLISSFYTLFPS